MPEGAASAGIQADHDAGAEVEGQGSQRIDVDAEAPDESETIAAPPSEVPPEVVDIASLAGPPGLPDALYTSPPKREAPAPTPPAEREDGDVDWTRLHALVTAVEALVSAGMNAEARPLLGQLRGIVEKARGPAATVIELAVQRSRR